MEESNQRNESVAPEQRTHGNDLYHLVVFANSCCTICNLLGFAILFLYNIQCLQCRNSVCTIWKWRCIYCMYNILIDMQQVDIHAGQHVSNEPPVQMPFKAYHETGFYSNRGKFMIVTAS